MKMNLEQILTSLKHIQSLLDSNTPGDEEEAVAQLKEQLPAMIDRINWFCK
jgi:hypothetical protein